MLAQGEKTVERLSEHARIELKLASAHIPFARSMPLSELEQRMRELPRGKPVVAYCRGPFCVMSDAAVQLLRARGIRVSKITDGVTEWRLAGLPIEGEGEATNEGS